MKFFFENKTWLVDPSNPPLFALGIKQIDGHHSSDMRDVSFRYAYFIASNLKHIYLPSQFNDVLSAKIVCQASKILTPHFQLSSSNLHCYRLQGIDLVNQIANILSVSVKESTNCELKLVDGVINLIRQTSGIQVVNKALRYQVHGQSVESKFKLFKKLRVHGNIASKYCPPLFIFNFLAKHKLQIHVPLSLNFTSKLPIIYKEIGHTRPTTQQLLIDCISLLAKKELLKSTFNIFKSTKLIIQNTVSETKAIPPLFYVSLSKCGDNSKVGFQESISTKRPFQGGNASVAVFRLNDDTKQAGIYFESAIKISLCNLGITSVKRNSDHYKCNYNFLLMAIFNILDNDPSLSKLVKELHITSSFQIQDYLPLHNEFQSLKLAPEEIDDHLLSIKVPNINELNQSNGKMDRTTLDLLISLVKANSRQFGIKIIIQTES